MSYEPEIIESQDRDVLKKIAARDTLAVSWDASQDPEFFKMMEHVRAFRSAALDEGLLEPVERYAQSIIDNEIDPILRRGRFSFSGYNPLHIWAEEGNGEVRDVHDAEPHRDYPCIGVFFNFNDQAGLNTFYVPGRYVGEEDIATRGFPDADLTKAKSFAPQSVALVKLGEVTHYGPREIPKGIIRVAMHARYDLF